MSLSAGVLRDSLEIFSQASFLSKVIIAPVSSGNTRSMVKSCKGVCILLQGWGCVRFHLQGRHNYVIHGFRSRLLSSKFGFISSHSTLWLKHMVHHCRGGIVHCLGFRGQLGKHQLGLTHQAHSYPFQLMVL